MWKYLTDDKYNELLSSFNLVNTTNIKMINKILYGISNDIDANYEEIIIHKKNGGLRYLNAPSKNLKSIQRKILKNVLEEKIISNHACAYLKNSSIKDNAKPHINKKIILKLDIENFFDNVNFNMVYKTCFNETLYPKKLGILLTNLCVYNNQCCVNKRYKFPVIYELHAGRYQRLCGNFYDTILKRRSDYVNLYA